MNCLPFGKVNEVLNNISAMEMRRQFWEHGYHIRKINQAYFAFFMALITTSLVVVQLAQILLTGSTEALG